MEGAPRALRKPAPKSSVGALDLGEVAMERWARSRNYDVVALFRDPRQADSADILINKVRVEVKTWSSEYWEALGRCYTPEQASTLDNKADLVMWCVLGESVVVLAGWSLPDEVVMRRFGLRGRCTGESRTTSWTRQTCAKYTNYRTGYRSAPGRSGPVGFSTRCSSTSRTAISTR